MLPAGGESKFHSLPFKGQKERGKKKGRKNKRQKYTQTIFEGNDFKKIKGKPKVMMNYRAKDEKAKTAEGSRKWQRLPSVEFEKSERKVKQSKNEREDI